MKRATGDQPMAISEREQRGLAIAALSKIDNKNGVWMVPSQSGNGRYEVIHQNGEPRCTCPDFELRGGKCKHIYAVEYTMCAANHCVERH
jgi:hypothetical protein